MPTLVAFKIPNEERLPKATLSIFTTWVKLTLSLLVKCHVEKAPHLCMVASETEVLNESPGWKSIQRERYIL